jgi:hypothetical protein
MADNEALVRALRWGKNQFSLEPQPDQDLISPETAGDFALGMVPGVGQAMALRDMYRGYQAKDPVAMSTAALGLVPFGKLGSVMKNKIIAGAGAADAPYDAMLKARNALKKGADPEAVWQEHGVFKGYDKGTAGGQLKWEIPDTNAKFKEGAFQVDKAGKSTFGGKLGDLLDHLELFKNYPQLADMNVSAYHKKGLKRGGSQLGNDLEMFSKDPDDLLKVLLHETQHRVQDIEKFGRGGNPTQFASSLAREAVMDNPALAGTVLNQKGPKWKEIAQKSVGLYNGLPGEIESRSVEKRFGMTPELLRKYSPARTAKNMGYGPEMVTTKEKMPLFSLAGLDDVE